MIKAAVAGAFDVIHPGYIDMFKDCKQLSEYLVVFLHTDPSIERPNKLKPILSAKDRKNILLSLKCVDDVIEYTYEKELYNLLKVGEFECRFLGEDYRDKSFTGDDLKIHIHYLNRDHGWSTTKYKTLIANQINNERIS